MAQPPKSEHDSSDQISAESSPSASLAPADTPSTAAPDPAATSAPPGPGAAADDVSGDRGGAEDEVSSSSPAPIEDAVHPDAPDASSLPSTFAAMGLSDPMLAALGKLGWGGPTKVQAAAFGPMTGGRDLLVQSQTGSGKTGAFCLPWLAARFEPGDAKQTGVQLLVMTPTRELAKQVCDQLVKLAGETPLVPLPVYGGTAIGPQFDALKSGVHAVVGTPGRILDHIRRRTLDLSRVRTVVLDEADEMLSMGFLEDIHAILDACPRERQTTLFSATVPSDIERIARRYMKSPESLKLSGDDIAAAQIEHVYYSVPGTMRPRDLLSIVAMEEPGSTLVFCNTREETNLVANVLRREGFTAEALSSDLSQAAREHVLGAMRKGRLRFLVATDVASRGIDISHISHVVNYSFPQNAESYVHRTGRTGRAGRAGKAISLIGPHDMGNFYHLKLAYPSIEFSEANFPPREELEARRNETKLDQVSKRFPELVSPEWTVLARTLAADPRGEQVIAYLLSEAMSKADPSTEVARDLPEESDDDFRMRGRRGPRRERDGDRERGRSGDRERGRDRDRDRDEDRGRRRRRDRDHEPGRLASEAPVSDDLDAPAHAQPGEMAEAAEMGEATELSEAAQERGQRRRRRRRRDSEEHARPEDARTLAATGDSHDEDTSEDALADASDDTSSDRAEGGEANGRRRRRRRRRRGGGADEARNAHERDTSDAASDDEDEPADDGPSEPAPAPDLAAAATVAEGDAAVVEAVATDAALPEAADATEAPEATSDASEETVLIAAPCEATEGLAETDDGTSARGRRRRRRRRRRGGRGKDDGLESKSSDSHGPRDGDDEDDDDAQSAEGDGSEGDADGGKRRRRRRRGGRGKKSEAAEQHVAQDQIIIDIDEKELEVVRDQFGEIDELDDLTLKGRRRGVIDALSDEVELEDLSDEDTPPSPEEVSEGEEDDDDGSDDDASDDADGDESDESDDDLDEREAKKRKRRRRRRKKKKVEETPPELTAPPHKDFWEVWSAKFTYQEFEDDQFRGGTEAIDDEPDPEPEVEPERERERGREREPRQRKRRSRSSAPAATQERESTSREPSRDPATIGNDDGPMVTVALNIGRSHGKKSAHIRELLASDFGLEGRSVRNLTVKETSTEFRISTAAHDGLQSAVLGYVFDDIELELTLVEPAEHEEEDAIDTAPEGTDDDVALPDPVVLASAEGESDSPQPEV